MKLLPPVNLISRVLVLAGLAGLAGIAAASAAAGEPVKVILDTDIAEDVDDAGAMALLHALANRGEAEILGIMVSSRNEWSAPCVDAINTWYGRPDIPVGYQRGLQFGYQNTKDPGRDTPSNYAEAVSKACPHDLRKSSEAIEAAALYRKILAGQPDRSVTIVTVGFLTNLCNLLNSRPDNNSPLEGEALVRQKVKQWVCMGGRFPQGGDEYNLMWDTISSVRAVNDWPTPIVFSGGEIGEKIKVGARLHETPENNPVRLCYQHYNGLTNRESWDQTAVLYAVRGERDYWTLSEPGLCLMHHRVIHGHSEWIPAAGRQHRFLIPKMPTAELGKVIEDMMIEPPRTAK